MMVLANARDDFRIRVGRGVGLFLAREIIEAHGGEVRAQSDGDRGTRIEVRLPRGDASAGP